MTLATVLYDERVTEISNAKIAGEHLWLKPEDLRAATGWKLETEGLCKGDACVRTQANWLDTDGNVDLSAFANYMGQPVTREDTVGAWAFGESVNTRRDALFSLQAPDFSLPDLDGKLHSLSDFRGKKVFLYSWGSY
jgi:hypothetical protein